MEFITATGLKIWQDANIMGTQKKKKKKKWITEVKVYKPTCPFFYWT